MVVGPKGSTVKRIQQLTQTYIVTPSRGTDPVFEVVGAPDNVERARREIESRVQQQRSAGGAGGGAALRGGGSELPTPAVGCWTNPASGFPDVVIPGGGDDFPIRSPPIWNRGRLAGLQSGNPVPRGFADILSSLGSLGLLNDPPAPLTLDTDEGIGSLSPDPLGYDGSSWSRTASALPPALCAESTSGRRSWIDVDPNTGAGLGSIFDWSMSTGGSGSKALRFADSSSESPTDYVSLTPPRSPMACLFG